MLNGKVSVSEAVVRRCSVKKVPPTTLLKKRLWHRCFPVNFAKFLRTPFFYRTLLLDVLKAKKIKYVKATKEF